MDDYDVDQYGNYEVWDDQVYGDDYESDLVRTDFYHNDFNDEEKSDESEDDQNDKEVFQEYDLTKHYTQENMCSKYFTMTIKPKSFDAQMFKACRIFSFEEPFISISLKRKNEVLSKLLSYKDTIVLNMSMWIAIAVLLYLFDPVETRDSIDDFCKKYYITYVQDFIRYLEFFENN